MTMIQVQPRTAASLQTSSHDSMALQRPVRVLLVSCRLEIRKLLLQLLEALAGDVICCSTCVEADQVLARQSMDIVFCDEHLPDGSYADFIHTDNFDHRIPRVVVITRVGEWEVYIEALRKGAFGTIRSPWCATDVEMIVIRALHDEECRSFRDSAA